MEPRFEHDCEACQFLGNYEWEDMKGDLYWCDQQGSPTLVLRYGVEADYTTFPVWSNFPQLRKISHLG